MKSAEKLNTKVEHSPSQFADFIGMNYTSTVSKEHKKQEGQFFTPPEISNFMGSIAKKPTSNSISILDPGCGTAILTCSLIENLIQYDLNSIELVAYETDYELLPYTEDSLQYLKQWLKTKNIDFKYTLFTSDFIEDMAIVIKKHIESFDYIISNPPYFKLSKDDKRIKLLEHLVKGQPNIYSLFMAVAVNLLRKDGELIFIVPRSFASGQYFNAFRDYFFSNTNLNFVHLFKSRRETFDRDKVLQETLILKCSNLKTDKVIISTSEGIKDLAFPMCRNYHTHDIIDLKSSAKILHLPTSNYEVNVMRLFESWNNNLINFDIQISTGPVVSFRVREFLFEMYKNSTVFLAPLFWLHNVTKMKTDWPKVTPNKSQYINIVDETKNILLPNKNYIFLRRFSAKDDKSRLIAAPYFSSFVDADFIGVENKLNYIYKLKGELNISEAIGISALLNSNIYDTYFRTFNGNVNVSATEIRLMTFPDIEVIREIGDYLVAQNNFSEEFINLHVNKLFLNQNEVING